MSAGRLFHKVVAATLNARLPYIYILFEFVVRAAVADCVSLEHFIPVLLAFVVLGYVSSVPSQNIGWEERVRNDLFCRVHVKPGPHYSNNVEATFDFVERTKFQHKTHSTLLPFLATKSNVASTLLLVWTGLKTLTQSVNQPCGNALIRSKLHFHCSVVDRAIRRRMVLTHEGDECSDF